MKKVKCSHCKTTDEYYETVSGDYKCTGCGGSMFVGKPINNFNADLRDYFAGQALVGMLSGSEPTNWPDDTGKAKAAYLCADAMIKERNRD